MPAQSMRVLTMWPVCEPNRGMSIVSRKAPLATATSRRASQITRSEEHTSELQSRLHLVCRLLLEKKKKNENKAQLNQLIVHTPTKLLISQTESHRLAVKQTPIGCSPARSVLRPMSTVRLLTLQVL